MILRNTRLRNLSADCGLFSEIAPKKKLATNKHEIPRKILNKFRVFLCLFVANFLSKFEFAPHFRREFCEFSEKRREMTLIFEACS